jgi:hypothetical protein
MATIYTDTMGPQGELTAHILTDSSHIRPTIMCYYWSFDELHAAVKEAYGEDIQHVGRTTFVVEMSKKGMSYTELKRQEA